MFRRSTAIIREYHPSQYLYIIYICKLKLYVYLYALYVKEVFFNKKQNMSHGMKMTKIKCSQLLEVPVLTFFWSSFMKINRNTVTL